MESVVIVGGCGRVGLPLGIAFANAGLVTRLLDIDEATVAMVNAGRMPFRENGADALLASLVEKRRLTATIDPTAVAGADAVIVVIGTPVDHHFNPDLDAVPRALDPLLPHISDDQLIILRSTVYPGVTARVERLLADRGVGTDLAFCPERIAEGMALTELYELPQIVAARTERSRIRATELFHRLTPRIVQLDPEEAELAKLFTNAWRYIKFATANQFFMIANDRDLDYGRIRDAVVAEYPRAADLPGAGFTAGPCLFKDTMQLAAFHAHNFTLGQSAMMVNEGLPLYLVSGIESKYDLAAMTVGILGMAFKGESDDTRSSLSYKLKHILRFRARGVLTTDAYVITDPELLALEEVVERSDLLVIGAPHRVYRDLEVDKPVIDIWGHRNGTTSF